ncbi:MAG: hypothetical protein JW712_04435 [Dehalococcoidales bacterium]|nr:hypothetical protein [Dehalococcoidales bacterium]
MNLSDMKTLVRRDLHDEDSENYIWTDTEIERHIAHAVKDFSEAVPYEQKVLISTTPGSRDIDISTITERVSLEAVEYPVGEYPSRYRRYKLWGDVLTLLDEEIPDGSDAGIYYGKLHTLDVSTSTIPALYEDIITTGACGYAAVEWSVYAVNRVNVGGTSTPGEILDWGKERLRRFRQELKRLRRKNRVRINSMYVPYLQAVSRSTDYGP